MYHGVSSFYVRVIGDGGSRCTNCGDSRTTNGLCARCLDLPYCKVCKRHLPVCCINGGQRHICEVPRPGLRCFTNRIIFYTSLSHLFSILHTLRVFSYACLQNCEKRRTKRCTALKNVISETSLPVTRYDTSFETLINQHPSTRHRRHSSRGLAPTRVLTHVRLVVIRCKFVFRIFQFYLHDSVYFADPFAFNCTSTPSWFASFPTVRFLASPHSFTLRPSSSISLNPSTSNML